MEKTGVCRTAIGIAIQAAKLLDRPYQYLKYTTLNERYNINAEAHAEITKAPNLGYIAIGRKGHRTHKDDHDVDIIDIVPHETTDTGPFLGIPFVMRRTNDDLSSDDRAKYALRRKETHNGLDYWAYYLKRLTTRAVAPEVIHDNTADGITTSRVFQYTSDDLYPVPSELPPTGVVVSSADIIRISSRVEISFDERDVEELYNVYDVLYGSSSGAAISELLICAGHDQEVRVEGENGATIKMTEAVGVQVVTFVSTFIGISQLNRGYHHEFELGEGEPLLTKGERKTTRYSIDVKPSVQSATLAGTIYDASNPNNGNGVSTTATINGKQ